MSKRMIKLILSKKFDAWLKSIDDTATRELAKKNTIITGGSIASMLLKEQIHDFDFYFKNYETCHAIAQYYVNKFVSTHDHLTIVPNVITVPSTEDQTPRVRIRIESAGVVGEKTEDSTYQYFEGDMRNGQLDHSLMPEGEDYIDEAITQQNETSAAEVATDADEVDLSSTTKSLGNLKGSQTENEKFRPVYLTDNAITLSDKVQLIIRFYGAAEEIHKNYDFVHCTNYWDSETRELVLKQEALESLLLKRLYYVGSRYPICSFIRTRKFISRGWFIDAGQMVKICFQISKLDLENLDVLEDQLTGVDQAYFVQLITYMREEKAKNPNWAADLPYVVSLIDKIF